MIYEVTVKYLNDEAKPVKESILICEAVNFAEAEAIALSEYSGYDSIDVVAVKRSAIQEVRKLGVYLDVEIYEVTTLFTTIDEVTAKEKKTAFKEKKTAFKYAVVGDSIYRAQDYVKKNILEHNEELVSIKLTKFISIYDAVSKQKIK